MKPRPILLLFLFALMAFLAWRNEQITFLNGGQLAVRQDGASVVLTWRSGVDAPMAKRFSEAYSAWAGDTGHFIIDLNSPGGALSEGRAVIEVIDRMKRTHRVDTRVGPGRKCLSMCVPIFLQGETRTAAANARFMFHEPTSRDAITGEVVDTLAFEQRMISERFFNRYFVNSPMDPAWAADLRRKWRGRDVWKSGRDLVREGSNIITDLE